MMVAPGDVVVADFPGAVQVKRRPAVVLSSGTYHRERPDVILGLITGNLSAASAQTDHVLGDWQSAGLHRPSAFRSYLITIDRRDVIAKIGRVSHQDWSAIRAALGRAFPTT